METIRKSVRLTGWRAAAVTVACLVAAFGWRAVRASSFDTRGRAAVESYLVLEAQRPMIDSVASALAKAAEGDIAPGFAAGQALLRTHQLAVRTLGVHGFGDTLHVRVTYRVPGDEAERVRYLRVTHSLVGGWHVVGSSSAFGYYTRL